MKSAGGGALDAPAVEAFQIEGAERPGRWLITCDHATNLVPDWVSGGDLGLPPSDMERHIAWDPGALGVARALGKALDCPVIWSRFSRLVIDPNRGEHDPTLVMRLYDGSIIPANRRITPEGIEERLARLHRPYHAALAALAARQDDTVLVSVHSYTRQLKGRAPRPWDIGILHSWRDSRLSRPVIARLAGLIDTPVGDNQPYDGHLPGDAVDRHALAHGRHNTLIELCNDRITTPADQAAWAELLAPVLRHALEECHDG